MRGGPVSGAVKYMLRVFMVHVLFVAMSLVFLYIYQRSFMVVGGGGSASGNIDAFLRSADSWLDVLRGDPGIRWNLLLVQVGLAPLVLAALGMALSDKELHLESVPDGWERELEEHVLRKALARYMMFFLSQISCAAMVLLFLAQGPEGWLLPSISLGVHLVVVMAFAYVVESRAESAMGCYRDLEHIVSRSRSWYEERQLLFSKRSSQPSARKKATLLALKGWAVVLLPLLPLSLGLSVGLPAALPFVVLGVGPAKGAALLVLVSAVFLFLMVLLAKKAGSQRWSFRYRGLDNLLSLWLCLLSVGLLFALVWYLAVSRSEAPYVAKAALTLLDVRAVLALVVLASGTRRVWGRDRLRLVMLQDYVEAVDNWCKAASGFPKDFRDKMLEQALVKLDNLEEEPAKTLKKDLGGQVRRAAAP